MKTTNAAAAARALAITLVATAAAVFVVGCGGGGDDAVASPQGGSAQAAQSAAALETSLATMALAAISTEEADSLVFMREEEKLALDVYAAMFSIWGSNVFKNIGASEQTHMDAVKLLLTRYALPDPAEATLPGQFGNAMLQGLYYALVASGRTSLVAALQVGAEIEDLDIRDLRAIKATVDNADLLLVCENLEKGSRNHLRAFHDNLLRQGASYTPRYITQAEYDAIVNSPKERG